MTIALDAALLDAKAAMNGWNARFAEAERAWLDDAATSAELMRLAYVDGYLRIKRTMPLILHAIERFDGLGKKRQAAFWLRHLQQESFHDAVMRRDLGELFPGRAELRTVLRAARMTPPSTALIGYFEWNVQHGQPDLLIALRLYLEWYLAGLESWSVAKVDRLLKRGSRIFATHRELDQEHLVDCLGYIDRHCRPIARELDWSIRFVGDSLADAHAYLARTLLDRRS